MVKLILSLISIFLVPAVALQGKNEKQSPPLPVYACSDEVATLTQQGIETSWDQFPKKNTILVARKASFQLRDQSGALIAQAQQNFKLPMRTLESQLCQQKSLLDFERFTMAAPTLIDFTNNPNVGHKVWNFQMFQGQKGFESTSQASFRPAEDALPLLMKAKQMWQLDHYSVRIEFVSLQGTTQKSLIVDYDLVSKI